jgi:hypothetical protein
MKIIPYANFLNPIFKASHWVALHGHPFNWRNFANLSPSIGIYNMPYLIQVLLGH